MKCQADGCGCQSKELFLHPRCHREAQLQVMLDQEAETLHVQCGVCDSDVVVLKAEMKDGELVTL